MQIIRRGNIFRDSTHIAAYNPGIFAGSVYPEKNSSYAVFFSTYDSLIYQHKVSISYKKNDEVSEPAYIYTILDTLESSQLLLKPDGSIDGKNLVEIKQ